MNIEDKIKDKIKSLEDYIGKADKDIFENTDHSEYLWVHCGIRENYDGKLEALKDLLDEVTQNKPRK